MGIRAAWLVLGSILAVVCLGCRAEPEGPPPPPPPPPIVQLTDEEAVEQMVTRACEAEFYDFTSLNGPLSACATFIFAVDAKGGVDPTPFQAAIARGDDDAATQAVFDAWTSLWRQWFVGATIVCDQTADGPQDATELEITLSALEAVAPRLSRQIYSESQANFCPSILLPPPPPGPMTVQAAELALCAEAVSNLPDLIDAGASDYWTEVVQVIANAMGIAAGPIDGDYGPQTIAGVKELQRLVGVVDDGQVGPITWSALQDFIC